MEQRPYETINSALEEFGISQYLYTSALRKCDSFRIRMNYIKEQRKLFSEPPWVQHFLNLLYEYPEYDVKDAAKECGITIETVRTRTYKDKAFQLEYRIARERNNKRRAKMQEVNRNIPEFILPENFDPKFEAIIDNVGDEDIANFESDIDDITWDDGGEYSWDNDEEYEF